MIKGARAKVTAKFSAREILRFFAAAWKRDFKRRKKQAARIPNVHSLNICREKTDGCRDAGLRE
jgi:hypothetical protein